MQWWWARVLAGEIAQPGRLSPGLLHLLSILRKSEAQTFALFANYVWEDSCNSFYQIYNDAVETFLREKRGLDYRAYSSLQSRGVLDANPSLGITLHAGQALSVYYGGNTYCFHPNSPEDKLPIRMLTDVGKELFSLCQPAPDDEYVELVLTGMNTYSRGAGKMLYDSEAPLPDGSLPESEARWA